MNTVRTLLFSALAVAPMAAFALGPIGGGGGGNNPDPTPPGAACDSNQLSPGTTTRTITIDGQRREYILHVPRSYTGQNEVPLLLDFHALSSGADYQSRNSGTADVANNEGFIVAYPQGIDNAWNIGPCCTESRRVDDIGFARQLVDTISAQACIDEKRVYATGYSNGGGMSYKLACDAADKFAAVAPAAFDMIEELDCRPERPVSVFASRGQRDFIVPFEGGRSTPPTRYRLDPIHFLGAEGSFERWGELNSCSGQPQSIGNSCESYNNCAGGTEVVLCTSRLGGHRAWDAEQSWNFLKNHTLP